MNRSILALLLLLPASGLAEPRLVCPDAGHSCAIDGHANPLEDLGLATPIGAAFAPDGSYLYVANNFGDTYSALRFSDNGVLSLARQVSASQDCFPVDLAIMEAQGKLYLSCFGPDLVGDRLDEGHLEAFVKVDGDIYNTPSIVPRIDLDRAPNPGGSNPRPYTSVTDMLPHPGGRYLYISYIEEESCFGIPIQFGTLAILDTATDSILDRFPRDSDLCGLTRPQLTEPLTMTLSKDARKLYVAPHKSFPPHIAELALSAAGDKFEATGDYPRLQLCEDTVNCQGSQDTDARDPAGLLLSRDGKKLYVTHNGLDESARFRITVLSTTTRSILKRITLPDSSSSDFVGYNPGQPGFTQHKDRILVPLYGNTTVPGTKIVILDPATDERLGAIDIPPSGSGQEPAKPVNIVPHPFKDFVYSVNNQPDTITVLSSYLEVPAVYHWPVFILALGGIMGLFLKVRHRISAPLLALTLAVPFMLGLSTRAENEIPETDWIFTADVTDSSGTTTHGDHITVEGSTYFTVQRGKTTIYVPFDKIQSAEAAGEAQMEDGIERLPMKFTFADGNTDTGMVRGRHVLYGSTNLGTFQIKLKDLRALSFTGKPTEKPKATN